MKTTLYVMIEKYTQESEWAREFSSDDPGAVKSKAASARDSGRTVTVILVGDYDGSQRMVDEAVTQFNFRYQAG